MSSDSESSSIFHDAVEELSVGEAGSISSSENGDQRIGEVGSEGGVEGSLGQRAGEEKSPSTSSKARSDVGKNEAPSPTISPSRSSAFKKPVLPLNSPPPLSPLLDAGLSPEAKSAAEAALRMQHIPASDSNCADSVDEVEQYRFCTIKPSHSSVSDMSLPMAASADSGMNILASAPSVDTFNSGFNNRTSPHSTGSSRRGRRSGRWSPRALFSRSSPTSEDVSIIKAESSSHSLAVASTASTDESDDGVFRIKDKDTGATYDIRELENGNIECSLFPSKSELLGMQHAIWGSMATTGSLDGTDVKSVRSVKSWDQCNPSTKRKATLKSASDRSSSVRNKKSTSFRRKRAPSPLTVLPKNAVPVKSSHKPSASSAFDPLLLIGSRTHAHEGPIWRMAFSQDGRYLATAGEDAAVLIWEVAPTRNTRQADDETVEQVQEGSSSRPSPPPFTHGTAPALGCEIEIISSTPIRCFREHTADVVDLSWSHTNFLLSASLDKTVRLWHVSRPRCLHVFQHSDFVSCVDFHPTEDALFLSGSFDRKLRVWSIPNGKVKEWAQAPDIVTSARYVPSAEFIVAGLYHGQLIFYYADSLKYYTQIRSANRHGRTRGGKKVTGFAFLRTGAKSERSQAEESRSPAKSQDGSFLLHSNSSQEKKKKKKASRLSPRFIQQSWSSFSRSDRSTLFYKEQMLVTTNDSRVRMFGLEDFCVRRKYKGLRNGSVQIIARTSESGDYIICGSDNGFVFIWDTSTSSKQLRLNVSGMQNNYDKSNRFEYFQASKASPPIVTDTLFVPSRALKNAFNASGLFPTLTDLDSLQQDFSSGAILTSDYSGTIRIFLQKTLLSDILKAAGPEGVHVDLL